MTDHQFHQLNTFKKLQLKLSDPAAYQIYKYRLKQHQLYLERKNAIAQLTQQNALLNPKKIQDLAGKSSTLNFLHSGNSGDIIYALPTIKAAARLVGKPVNLFLKVDQQREAHPTYTHPLGMVMLNRETANMLTGLIEQQDYITSCAVFEGEKIDIDLDNIRKSGIRLDRGSITKWYGFITGLNVDTAEPWLKVNPNQTVKNKVVVARSQRYRNPFIDYSFLKYDKDAVFIGLKTEYDDMHQVLPNLNWQPVKNFLEMAEIIASAKLFIGNQSLPFALAEGLKVKRLLECDYEEPNVIPEGKNGESFYFQKHFEYLVDAYANIPIKSVFNNQRSSA